MWKLSSAKWLERIPAISRAPCVQSLELGPRRKDAADALALPQREPADNPIHAFMISRIAPRFARHGDEVVR